MSVFSSRANILKEALALEEESYQKRKKAGVKKGWNHTFAMQLPSKNDIQRACNADLRYLNDKCVEKGWAPIYEDPDDVEVKPGKVVQ